MNEVIELIDKYEQSIAGVRKKLLLPDLSSDQSLTLENYCIALKHKLKLIMFVLNIIERFDWNVLHGFDEFKKTIKETPTDNYFLESDVINADFPESKYMMDFIHIVLMEMFSLIISSVGVLALIYWVSLDLQVIDKKGKEIKDKRLITINRILKALPSGVDILKRELEKHIISDKWFLDLKNIRNACEHDDHTQIFVWSDKRKAALGNQPSGVPLINEDLFSNPLNKHERYVTKYPVLIYQKLNLLLNETFTVLLLTVASNVGSRIV